MHNLQSFQNISGFSNTNAVVTLQSYIKSLSGLVAYYPMDETSGTTAVNQAPDTLGTLDGTITGATINQAGQSGTAYSFDGVNDIVTVLDNDLLDIIGAMSIFAIVKPIGNGGGNFGRIVDKSMYAYTTSNNLLYSTNVSVGGSSYEAGASAAVHNEWTYAGFTWNKDLGTNQGTHFKNGVSIGNFTQTNPNTANATDLHIGNRAALDRTFNGQMQHVALFSRAITTAEVLQLAQRAVLA